MSKKKKIMLPPSAAGLVRYGEEEGKGLKLDPKHIIAAIVIVIIGEIILHMGI